MKRLAVFHLKGGAGKTTTAINLAFLAAHQGYRVLLCDMDQQGAASYFLKSTSPSLSHKQWVKSPEDWFQRSVEGTLFENLDLLPAGQTLFRFERWLVKRRVEEKKHKTPTAAVLAKTLDRLKGRYDVVFFDCGPSFGLLNENLLFAADAILMPTLPTTLSVRTLPEIQSFVASLGAVGSLWTFFNMVELRKSIHKQTLQTLRRDWPFSDIQLLYSTIPYNADIERSAQQQSPFCHGYPHHPLRLAYEGLWHEWWGLLTAQF
jgi:cellulose biosynthesis protein BcsQ